MADAAGRGQGIPRCCRVDTAALNVNVLGIPAVEGPFDVNIWFLSLAFSQDVVDGVGLSRQLEPQWEDVVVVGIVSLAAGRAVLCDFQVHGVGGFF